MTRSPSAALPGEQAPARVRVEPQGGRANSWEDVADLSASFGLTLDPWQEDVLRASMGERADGRWTAARVGLSAPRQNGKSQLIVARALAGVLLFGERKIVISAHLQDTARETFMKFDELRENSPALDARIEQTMYAFGREFIKFKNGARIQFRARTGPGSRGFSSDCLFLDEAQILKASAWASINSTMSAMSNPQVWLMGTPPTPEDDGAVFAKVRSAATSGKSAQSAYLEWSAEPSDDPASEEARAKANPAWFTRINHDVVQGEYETYSPEQFARERLGIWDDDIGVQGAIDMTSWAKCLHPSKPTTSPVVLSVETVMDRSSSTIVAVGSTSSGKPQVKVLASRPGTAWVADTVVQIASDHSEVECLVIDGRAAAASLVDAVTNALELAGVDVELVITNASDVAQACGQVMDAILDGKIRHCGDAALDAAVRGATQRDMGDGAWAWSRRKGGPVVAPLVAMTLAHWQWRQLMDTPSPMSQIF